MLTLVTTNPAKYAPFAPQLQRLRIQLEPVKTLLPEIQTLDFAEALAAKARAATEFFGRPVLVDDAGVVLEAYHPFPGPLTGAVIRSLGVAGLKRLLSGLSDRASMQCHIGGWFGGALRSWSGQAPGRLDLSRSPAEARMLLTDLFVPDCSRRRKEADALDNPTAPTDPSLPEPADASGKLLHRARALAALEADVFDLHLQTTVEAQAAPCSGAPVSQCPFCAELDDEAVSIFAEMMGGRLASRVVYADEHFVVMPPLGQFIEGGLLLLARPHILSFAHLPAPLYEHLDRLLRAIRRALLDRYGTAPLIFEHGPAPQRTKGVCCVDHAHLNIFPAQVHLHPPLAQHMHLRLGSLADLARLRCAEYGYLFIQENDGSRRAYDAQDVPTQLVRRIITAALGLPQRWHWRDYPGENEIVATCSALKGQIRL